MISVDTYHLLGPFNINLGDFCILCIIFSSQCFNDVSLCCLCIREHFALLSPFVFCVFVCHISAPTFKIASSNLCDQSPSLCLSLLWLDESWVPVRQVSRLSQERFSFHFSSQLFSITTSHLVVITHRFHLCGLCFASLWARVEFFFVTLGWFLICGGFVGLFWVWGCSGETS